MSYVIQNFHFSNKKIIWNFRIKYFFLLNNTALRQLLLKFCIIERQLFHLFFSSTLIFKILQHFKVFAPLLSLYRNTAYTPLNYSNNFYLSVVFWNLRNYENPHRCDYKFNIIRNISAQTPSAWFPIRLNNSEINKNFYDKIIFLFFLHNHFFWGEHYIFWQINRTFFVISSYLHLNVFFNTLFFPIHNF